MGTGVRAEEVGYQLKYSKQELRKCIKEYGGKDVKKGLESMYQKIVKHTSEFDNRLLRVCWDSLAHVLTRHCCFNDRCKRGVDLASVVWYFCFSLFLSDRSS